MPKLNEAEFFGAQPAQPDPQAAPQLFGGAFRAPRTPEAIAQEQREAERLNLAQQSAAQSAAANARAQAEFERKQQQIAASGGIDASVEQGRAGGFALRATRANQAYEGAGLDPDTLVGQTASLTFPGITSALSSDPRNAQRARERDFVAAVLRYESGAAIPPSEYETAYAIYFPSANAGPEEIEAKRQARANAIEGLRLGAGPAAVAANRPNLTPEQQQQALQQAESGAQQLLGGQFDPFVQQSGPQAPRPTGPISDEESISGLRDRIARGDSAGSIVQWLNESGRPPSAAEIDQIVNALASGGRFRVEGSNRPAEGLNRAFQLGVGDIVEGAGDILGLVGNPVNAGINWALGTDLSTDLGQTFREASGLPSPESDQEQLASAINRAGVGGFGITTPVRAGVPLATGALQAGLARYSANPLTDLVAGAGAGAGQEIARQQGAGPIGQTIGALAGGGVGLAGANRIANAGQPRQIQPIAQAAQRQNVDLLPADVGGTLTRRLTAAGAQGPVSAGPIVAGARRSQEQLGEAAARTARRAGNVLDDDDAGLLARQGAENFSKQTSQRGSRLYDRAEKASGGVKITPSGAVQAIDNEIARLSETPEINAPLINELNRFKESLSRSGGISVSGLRDARTIAGKASFTEALRSTPAKAVFGRVMDAISNDISSGLQAAGRGEADSLFKVADRFWKERVELIDKVLEPVVGGNKSGEQILRSIEGLARGKGGGVRRLARLINSLPENDAADIQATIIDRLGREAPGQQTGAQAGFSSQTFLTNWNNMSEKGKAALFPDPQVRSNLNDIAEIAGGTRQAQRFANTSNTAGGVAGQLVLTGGAGVAGGFPGLLAATAAQYLSGRALASKALTNWLAKAPKTNNPAAQRVYLSRLGTIAARDPVIANEVQALQQRLLEAGQSTGRLAAQDDQGQ